MRVIWLRFKDLLAQTGQNSEESLELGRRRERWTGSEVDAWMVREWERGVCVCVVRRSPLP